MTGRTTLTSRVLHGVFYGALLLAGLVYMLARPETFAAIVGPEVVALAGGFMVAGSAGGLASVVTTRPWFEFLTLPLLLGGMVVYVLATVIRIRTGATVNDTAAWVVVLFRLAVIGLVTDRWLYVRRLLRGAA